MKRWVLGDFCERVIIFGHVSSVKGGVESEKGRGWGDIELLSIFKNTLIFPIR